MRVYRSILYGEKINRKRNTKKKKLFKIRSKALLSPLRLIRRKVIQRTITHNCENERHTDLYSLKIGMESATETLIKVTKTENEKEVRKFRVILLHVTTTNDDERSLN